MKSNEVDANKVLETDLRQDDLHQNDVTQFAQEGIQDHSGTGFIN
jgi:hypothetical protein